MSNAGFYIGIGFGVVFLGSLIAVLYMLWTAPSEDDPYEVIQGDWPAVPDRFGRVGSADQALVASDGAASRLRPPGFDPSRNSNAGE